MSLLGEAARVTGRASSLACRSRAKTRRRGARKAADIGGELARRFRIGGIVLPQEGRKRLDVPVLCKNTGGAVAGRAVRTEQLGGRFASAEVLGDRGATRKRQRGVCQNSPALTSVPA